MNALRVYIVFILVVNSTIIATAQEVVREIGDVVQIAIPLTGLGISLATSDKDGTYQIVQSMAVQTVTTHLLKRTIKRRRPNGSKYSFPSGHTSLSFMGSTFLWKRYGWKYGVPATLAASFVGYSRAGINDPVHHPSDVFAGAAIGILSSFIFTKVKDSDNRVDIIGDSSFVGLKLNLNLTRNKNKEFISIE